MPAFCVESNSSNGTVDLISKLVIGTQLDRKWIQNYRFPEKTVTRRSLWIRSIHLTQCMVSNPNIYNSPQICQVSICFH